MKGTVLNIQRFCTEDGPGIRTTVFLKGCPLHCVWCHNPESQKSAPELLYDSAQCVNCLRCVKRCPNGCHTLQDGRHAFDRTACIACGACTSPLCNALLLSGTEMTAEDVLKEVLKDRTFYEKSGGGMTLSGGEPLLQASFAQELLRAAKEAGIHTAVETCGFVPKEALLRTAPLIDLYLFDCKETDPARHKAYTGVDTETILQNLNVLSELGKRIILRCPIIPTLNDRTEHLHGIAELANACPAIEEIAVEPYHSFGASKYGRLGREYTLGDIDPPSEETVSLWIGEIRRHTKVTVKKA